MFRIDQKRLKNVSGVMGFPVQAVSILRDLTTQTNSSFSLRQELNIRYHSMEFVLQNVR